MADRAVHAERRMSDVEALMWNLEKDPHLSSTFANVTLLDRAPDRDALRARISGAVDSFPRLRQHVVPAFGRLAPPEWRIDPEFDLDRHLRWTALPQPASQRDVFDLATALASEPFDRARPLWEFVVIEGLPGGRAAMVQKMHHTITDGEGGVRLSEQFLDLTRDAEGPMVVRSPGEPVAEPAGFLPTVLDTLGHAARRQLGIAARTLRGAPALADPRRLVAAGDDAVDLVRSAIRQLAVTGSARSPLWTERSLRRRFEPMRVPFDDAKRAAKSLGGSLNDLFVAAAAGGAARYHIDCGSPVHELRLAMPVSTRARGTAGGNAFTPTRFVVPVDAVDPRERFLAVQARIAEVRAERSISAAETMAGLVNLLPTSVAIRLARQQVETVDFATSNVRGAPIELYVAGALIEANHPMGPLGGTAFNLTLLSYRGNLDMGLNVDSGAVARPDLLRDCIALSFEELLAAG
jgi:WS/DGAT/MGAT family acyltransferase